MRLLNKLFDIWVVCTFFLSFSLMLVLDAVTFLWIYYQNCKSNSIHDSQSLWVKVIQVKLGIRDMMWLNVKMVINKNKPPFFNCLLYQTHPKLQDLHTYISQAAPFGTPLDINPATVRITLTSKPSAQVSTHNKVL